MRPMAVICDVQTNQDIAVSATQFLESKHERARQDVAAACDKEQVRKLQLQICLLEGDIQDLYNQLAEDDDHIMTLDHARETAAQELSIVRHRLDASVSENRLKTREVETLKVQLASLRDITMDSTELLKEKLALDREISALRPEIDTLRTQVTTQQSVYAEKLALQQHCNALQIELENERRSTQRVNLQERKLQLEEGQYESQIKTLRKDLQGERRERQRVEREATQNIAASEAKNEVLESRLNAIRIKLKSTKDQLNEAQEKAKVQEVNAVVHSNNTRPIKANGMAATLLRKRKADFLEDNTTIGTPGNANVMKVGRRPSAVPGEKSMFSTTPFLNRTASFAPEGSDSDCQPSPPHAREAQVDPVDGKAPLTTVPASSKRVPHPKLAAREDRASSDERSQGATDHVRLPSRKLLKEPALAHVAEEEDCSLDGRNANTESASMVDIRKKKRKVLGGNVVPKTLFDEDEGESNAIKREIGSFPRPNTILGGLAVSKKIGLSSRVGTKSAFGVPAFSPLKKDRRVGTSFID